MGTSRMSERLSKLPADHFSVTDPVNIDQNARRRIAANAQNLYVFRPNIGSIISFFDDAVGITSSNFISFESPNFRRERVFIWISPKEFFPLSLELSGARCHRRFLFYLEFCGRRWVHSFTLEHYINKI